MGGRVSVDGGHPEELGIKWGILLSWPNRVPAKGWPRTLASSMGDEGWDQVPGLGGGFSIHWFLAEFFAKPGVSMPGAGSRLRSGRGLRVA